MKKIIVTSIAVAAVAATTGAYYHRHGRSDVVVSTASVTRGPVVRTVSAAGTLEAVQTVQVGTQVSANVKELYADFNDIVRKGQLVARLDPSTLETQLAQARANLDRARADADRLKVAIEDAKTTLARTEALAAKRLATAVDLESARTAVRLAEVQVRSAEAQVRQVEATVTQSEVNLRHTDIYSPIDGIVVSRNVDVGQTVAASLSAPTLFEIAADLTRMQVKASVDEADVGSVCRDQTVRFRVDAYPEETFTGTVSQVRLQPVTTQNVVTYTTVIDVPNPSLKLLPGMTAGVTIEIARRDEAARIPNTALRFRPTTAMFEAVGQAIPAGGVVSKGRQPANTVAGRPAASGARVWRWVDGRLEAVTVQIGVADDTYTELVGGLDPSVTDLVTGFDTGNGSSGAAASTSTARSPLMQGTGGGMPPPPPPF